MIPISKKSIIIVGISAVIIVLFFVSGLSKKIINLNPKTSQAPTQTQTQKSNTGIIIAARSDLTDYSVTVKNQVLFIQILNKMGIWGKIYNTGSQKGTKPLNQAFVILTDKKLQYEVFQNKNKDLLYSVGISFAEDTAMISVNLPASVLAQKNNSQIFDTAVGYAAFVITDPNITKPSSPDFQKYITFVQSYLNSGLSFFQIIKISSASARPPSPTPTPTK